MEYFVYLLELPANVCAWFVVCLWILHGFSYKIVPYLVVSGYHYMTWCCWYNPCISVTNKLIANNSVRNRSTNHHTATGRNISFVEKCQLDEVNCIEGKILYIYTAHTQCYGCYTHGFVYLFVVAFSRISPYQNKSIVWGERSWWVWCNWRGKQTEYVMRIMKPSSIVFEFYSLASTNRCENAIRMMWTWLESLTFAPKHFLCGFFCQFGWRGCWQLPWIAAWSW